MSTQIYDQDGLYVTRYARGHGFGLGYQVDANVVRLDRQELQAFALILLRESMAEGSTLADLEATINAIDDRADRDRLVPGDSG